MNKLKGVLMMSGLILLFMVSSCKVENKVTRSTTATLESGLVINWSTFGKGKKIAKGDAVSVHYTGRLENDTVFDSSVKRGQPISVKAGAGQVIKGWDEALLMMAEGDKAQLIIPANLAYGSRAVGSIPANSTLKFEIEIIKSVTPRQPDPWILSNADTVKLPSGLKYIMLAKGEGATVAFGRKVSVHYTGYLSDGKVFDSSVERGKPITFEAGAGKVIKGWDEAILKMKKNDRARLIIPPSLGYGDRQTGPIPAQSTLIFDIEIVDVTD